MKYPAFLRPIAAALLLAAACSLPATARAAVPQRAASEMITASESNAHPSFTVRVVGKGRPIILIPGLTCPGAVWDETVARYAARYQCHVLSLAGFGGTPGLPVTDDFLRGVRDQLLAYIKTQRLARPAIVGHSLGGFLGLWMSTAQADAIGPLLIVDSLPFLAAIQNPAITVATARPMAEAQRTQMKAGGMPLAARRQMLASMMRDTARQRQAAAWGQASDPATVAQAMYDLGTTDLRPDIAAIQQPVLVLGAWAAYQAYGATMASTRAIFEAQYARLPQHRIEMSAAGRHFLMWDDTPWFFEQTDAFLQANYPAAARR